MGMADKIKILLIKQKISLKELAAKLDCTSANLSNKFKRDNFSETELKNIAEALDCDFEATFIIRKTGERL